MPAQSSADGASSRRRAVKSFIDDAAEEYDDDEPESEDEDALAGAHAGWPPAPIQLITLEILLGTTNPCLQDTLKSRDGMEPQPP